MKQPHAMNLTAAAAVVIALLAGCATQQERIAWERWSAERDARAASTTAGTDELAIPAADEAELSEAGLPELQAYAARHNPGLASAYHDWTAALERIPQARALPDPIFSYGYFVQEVETRVGPQRQRFGLTQSLPWFGTLSLRGEIAALAADEAGAQYETRRLGLRRRVAQTYYELAYLERAVAVTAENLQLLQEIEQVVLARYRAGAAEHAAVIRTQLEIGRLSERLQSLADARRPAAAALNAVLGRRADAPLPAPHPIPSHSQTLAAEAGRTETSLSAATAWDWLRESNPRLHGRQAAIARQEAAIDLARREYFPSFALGADYIDTGEARMPQIDESGKDPILARFSIQLPLWFAGRRAATAEATSRYRAARQARDEQEDLLMAELERALYELRDAERKIALYTETLIPQAAQSIAVTRQAFAAGRSGFLDLIDAQRILLELQLAGERAAVNREQRWAEIEQLIGRPLESLPSGGDAR